MQEFADHKELRRRGTTVEKAALQKWDLRVVIRQQRKRCPNTLTRRQQFIGSNPFQRGSGQIAERAHLVDDIGRLFDFGHLQTLDERFGTLPVVLAFEPSNADCSEQEDHEHNRSNDRCFAEVVAAGGSHHSLVPVHSVATLGQQQYAQPLETSRQLFALRPCIPQRRPLEKQKLGPATHCFSLLTRQPLPKRRHQIVVRQLEVLRSWIAAGCCLNALRIGGRYQPQFAVENAEQIVKFRGTMLIARNIQQLHMGPHVPFDVRANLRQQCLENFTSGLLMEAMIGVGDATS